MRLIVTENRRSETWDIEKMRSFRTWTIQEQAKVMESLSANPEESQIFLELLEQEGKE